MTAPQGPLLAAPVMTSKGRAGALATGYHHGNLGPTLIEASIEILEQHGVAGLSLRAAARGARVSHTAPYNHFADREALLAAVVTEGFRRLGRCVSQAASDQLEPRTRLRELSRAYLDFALGQSGLYALMFGDEIADRSRYPELEKADAETADFAREVTAACLARSARRTVSAETATVAGWAMLHGLADLLVHQHIHLPSERSLDEKFRDEIADFFLESLIPEDALEPG